LEISDEHLCPFPPGVPSTQAFFMGGRTRGGEGEGKKDKMLTTCKNIA